MQSIPSLPPGLFAPPTHNAGAAPAPPRGIPFPTPPPEPKPLKLKPNEWEQVALELRNEVRRDAEMVAGELFPGGVPLSVDVPETKYLELVREKLIAGDQAFRVQMVKDHGDFGALALAAKAMGVPLSNLAHLRRAEKKGDLP